MATIHERVIEGFIGEISNERLLNIYRKYTEFFANKNEKQ